MQDVCVPLIMCHLLQHRTTWGEFIDFWRKKSAVKVIADRCLPKKLIIAQLISSPQMHNHLSLGCV